MRAVLRRGQTEQGKLVCGRVSIDKQGHRVWVDGKELVLTGLEFRILVVLATRSGRVYTREGLLAVIWGEDADITVRTVDTHVVRLREKLGPAAEQLQTIRGAGYRFTSETSRPAA